MIVLVVGNQNSGKSQRAEAIAIDLNTEYKYYLATMIIYDDEGITRVKKHRQQREGKGFETVEMAYGIDKVLDKIIYPKESTVLLECMANLIGNEMYENPKRIGLCKLNDLKESEFIREIMVDINKIARSVKNLVIVTNEYTVNEACDEMTRLYIRLLDMINLELREISDKVIDVRNNAGDNI